MELLKFIKSAVILPGKPEKLYCISSHNSNLNFKITGIHVENTMRSTGEIIIVIDDNDEMSYVYKIDGRKSILKNNLDIPLKKHSTISITAFGNFYYPMVSLLLQEVR